MPAKYRDDPYGGYNFEVVINGISDDGTAVKAELRRGQRPGGRDPADRVPQRRGGHHGPQGVRPEEVPEHRPQARDDLGDIAMWNWIQQAMDGKVQRTEGSVVLLDENKQEVMRWNFKRGWPCK